MNLGLDAMREKQQLKLLGIVAAGFVVPALAIVALQLLPATAKPLSYVFAPYYAGILMQLMLLVIAGLAIIGEVPRWALAAPLAVWIGGAGYWWVERSRLLEGMRARAQPIGFAAKVRPIVVTGQGYLASAVAQNLIANFAVDEVYTEQGSAKDQFRFTLATGDACALTVENRRRRQPWQTARLKANDACVVREKASPPAGGVEVSVGAFVAVSAVNAIAHTPIVFSARGKAGASTTRIDIVTARAPLPFLLPIAGCWITTTPSRHECVLALAKSPFLLTPDPHAVQPPLSLVSFMPAGDNAYYAGGALGLEQREHVKTAAP
jgi:hypothetical protein